MATEQFFFRDDAATVAHEVDKQAVFHRLEANFSVFARQAFTHQVDAEVPEGQVAVPAAAPFQHGLYLRKEHTQRVRFADIIVAADV